MGGFCIVIEKTGKVVQADEWIQMWKRLDAEFKDGKEEVKETQETHSPRPQKAVGQTLFDGHS